MKHGSTLLLKGVISLIALAVLALCVLVLPAGIQSNQTGMYRSLLLWMYLPAIPFFIGVYQTFQLLRFIDAGTVFSSRAVQRLAYLKYCGLAASGLYAVALPYIYRVAEQDDAPGVMLIGLIFTLAPLIIGVFAGVLQRMLNNAMALKTENDLTV